MDDRHDYLPQKEREVVALISKYHRAAMPLRGTGKWEKGKDFGLTAEALEKVIPERGLHFRDDVMFKKRILLLGALLRAIDALDIQSDRVIDENYWNERRRRTLEEVEFYQNLLDRRLKFLGSDQEHSLGCISNIVESQRRICSKWKESLENYGIWDYVDDVRREIEEQVEPKLIKIVSDALKLYDNVSLQRELLLEVLSLLDKICFKMLQEAHFRKHSVVKLVYLAHREQVSSGDAYRIQMVFDNEIKVTDEQKSRIAGEIWKEIENVRQLLSESGITVEGIFEGERRISLSQVNQ